MKKRLVSMLLALAMCMGLAVPAVAVDVNSSSTVASELSVSANEIDMSMPYHYSKTFLENGQEVTIGVRYEPAAQTRSGSKSDPASEGVWTSYYNSPILSMSYKYGLEKSGSHWKVSNARDHRYSAIGYSTSNPSLKIARSISTASFPAEINASVQYTLITDLLFTSTGVVNTTVSDDGIVTVSWN